MKDPSDDGFGTFGDFDEAAKPQRPKIDLDDDPFADLMGETKEIKPEVTEEAPTQAPVENIDLFASNLPNPIIEEPPKAE